MSAAGNAARSQQGAGDPGTIRTRIPARLDRLPWARFHWMVVAGLGTVWILDGVEVTNVGAVASRMTEKGSGIALSASGIGTAAAIYVIGACLGALFFGQLTDRFGRKRLFMITLGIYIVATTATAFSFAPWYFYLCRFVTGAGIGGEYASINSAIDELIPARARGRVDLGINGSYWFGSLAGSAAALLFLDQALFSVGLGWRMSFAVGAVIGLAVLLVRRNVPESPRWLFIHGREREAEEIVGGIERSIEQETGQQLADAERVLTVRQRERISFREIARVAFREYPRRSFLALALFIGQAFLYNGVTFDLGTLFTTFEKVSSSSVPIFVMIFAAGNFAGPLLLGRLFDTVGRKPMIAGTYLGSAALTALLAVLFTGGSLGSWGLEGIIVAAFFLASSGASAAYLTASEIFPMETRALAIAFFYAIGTGVGGVIGPVLFGQMIDSGHRGQVALAFWIGAGVMAVGGIAELFLGVRAEGASLEDIATPITVEDAEPQADGRGAAGDGSGAEADGTDGDGRRRPLDPALIEALEFRRRAEESRAWAAEHRARAHELRAAVGAAEDAGDGEAYLHAGIEEVLAQVADLRASALDERALGCEERARAGAAQDEDQRRMALERASAASLRAEAQEQQADALSASQQTDADLHRALSDAAMERARAREQRSLAVAARAEVRDGDGDAVVALHRARADSHDHWADMHERLAVAHELSGVGLPEQARAAEAEADELRELALAGEERVSAAQHRVDAEDLVAEEQRAEALAETRERAAARERDQHDRDARIRRRLTEREHRERAGLRRLRPGPGSSLFSPGMLGTAAPRRDYLGEEDLDREIEVIERALLEHGATDRAELARLVGARYWGPGRFGPALREAVTEGRAQRISARIYGPAGREVKEHGGSDRHRR